MSTVDTLFVNPVELLPDRRGYLENLLQQQRATAEVVRLCTCPLGGPVRPTPEQRAAIRVSRDNCPVHSTSKRR